LAKAEQQAMNSCPKAVSPPGWNSLHKKWKVVDSEKALATLAANSK